MKYTGNYNLKKPEGTDVVNIGDLNDNADIIDQELKAHNDALNAHKAEKATQEQLGHVKAGRNITIDADGTINAKGGNVDSVNGKTGVVNLTKADVGLGYVQNYGIASKAQAEVGTANDAYMTPLRVAQAIQQTVKTGQYTGDGSPDRTINVGFTPKAVLLFTPGANGSAVFVYSYTADAVMFLMTSELEVAGLVVRGLKITTNGFIVGQKLTGFPSLGNASNIPHFWIAFR